MMFPQREHLEICQTRSIFSVAVAMPRQDLGTLKAVCHSAFQHRSIQLDSITSSPSSFSSRIDFQQNAKRPSQSAKENPQEEGRRHQPARKQSRRQTAAKGRGPVRQIGQARNRQSKGSTTLP